MSAGEAKASIILTRPAGRNEVLAARLQGAGYQVLVLSALQIRPLALSAVHEWSPDLYDVVVFVSDNAVRCYLDALTTQYPGYQWPAHVRAATVGFASAQSLYRSPSVPDSCILHPHPASQSQDSEGLWSLFSESVARLKRVLIVRGSGGREWLGSQFENAGAMVERLAVYERQPVAWSETDARALQALLDAAPPVFFLLTSGEGVQAVMWNLQRLQLERACEKSGFIVIHERIAARLQSLLQASGKVEVPMVKICHPNDDAIFRAIEDAASREENT